MKPTRIEAEPAKALHLLDRMSVRLSLTFSMITMLVLVILQLFEIFGLPFTDFAGQLGTRRQEAFQTLSLLADLKEARLVRMFDERKGDALVASENDTIRRNLVKLIEVAESKGALNANEGPIWQTVQKEECYQDLFDELDVVQAAYGHYSRIQIAEVNSGRLVFSTVASDLGRKVSGQNFFQNPLLMHGVYVGDIRPATYGSISVLHVSCPVRNARGKMVGVIVLVMDVEQEIRPLLHTGDGLGKTGEALLVNNKVKVLTTLKHPLADGSYAKPLDYQIQARPAVLGAGGQEGIIETQDYRGVPVLAAYRHIRISANWGWGMVVKRDRDDLMAPMRQDMAYMFCFAGAAVLLIVVLAVALTQRMTRSLLTLTQVTSRFAAGDQSARSGLSGRDEISRLGLAFDQMADTLTESWQTMERRTEELEHTTDALQTQQAVQEGSLQIANTLSSAASLAEMVEQGLDHLMLTTRTQAGAFYLTDGAGAFELRCACGVSDPKRLPAEIRLGEGLLGLALQRQTIEIVPAVPEDTVFTLRSLAGESVPKSLIAIPLQLQQETLGVMALASMTPLSEESLEIVRSCRLQFATAISNALANARTAGMAAEISTQNAELAASNEELQSQSEELQAQAEELHATAVELKSQREQVEEASRLKSEFLSNMSHELRTPLNSVLALSQLMMTRGPGKDVATDVEHLQIIERNGRHLLNLINDILDISKIESGRMDLILTDFETADVLQEALTTVRPLAEAKGLALELGTSTLPALHTDREKFKQVLLNLLSNAVKFTDAGGVYLTTQVQDSALVIVVRDTGIGIDPVEQQHIFEEFRQVDGSNTRRFEGTGLGLAISQRLAHMLGGKIEVESRLQEGSLFKLIVPIHCNSSGLLPAPSAPSAKDPLKAGEKPVVMVVDDEREARQLICRHLEELGYKPVEAADGHEALRMARTLRPFAITLDIVMPEMDGWEALQKLKTSPETAAIPVIVVSMSHDRETGCALGAMGYVAKPVDPETLKAELERAKETHAVQTLLVVDDDLAVREQLKALLTEAGYTVAAVPDGEAALKHIGSMPPDAVILDLLMPGKDGFEVLHQIRSLKETRDLPVIVLTSKDLTRSEREELCTMARSIIAKDGLDQMRLRQELQESLRGLECRVYRNVSDVPHILVVEDNEIATLQICTALEQEGYTVASASNGQEGLAAVAHALPDGIILDLMMPGMDGFEVLEQIRSTPWTKDLPVLILTAKELTAEDKARLSANNVSQLIQKGSVDRTDLIAAVGRLVGRAAAATPLPAPATAPHVVELQSGERPILVVEDNADNLITIKAILDSINRHYITATDGQEGLDKARQYRPCLILMDVQLPVMNGLEATAAMKNDPALNSTPVIALTARAMKGDREEFLSKGFDDYMAKPIDPNALVQLIEKWTA